MSILGHSRIQQLITTFSFLLQIIKSYLIFIINVMLFDKNTNKTGVFIPYMPIACDFGMLD